VAEGAGPQAGSVGQVVKAAPEEEREGVVSLTEGANVVDGALVPVLASAGLDVGVYVEPNVWMEHAVEQPEASDSGS
jgi:hypothetical protein